MLMSPASAAILASASRANTSTGASSLNAGPRREARRVVPRRRELRPLRPVAASRHSPSAACSPPPAARCQAVAASIARPRSPRRLPARGRTRPRCTRPSAANRTSPVASAFSTASSRVATPGRVLTGLALRSSETGQLIGLRLQKPATARRLRRAAAGAARRRRIGAAGGPARRGRRHPGHAATGRRPRGASAARDRRPPRCAAGRRPRSRLWRRKARFAAWSHGRSKVVVEGTAAVGEFHRETELAVMRHDVGEVVRAASLQVDVIDGCRRVRWPRRCGAGEVEVTGGRLDPGREQQAAGPVPDRRGVAGRVERGQDPLRASAVAENDPGPAESVGDAGRRAAGRARRSRPTRRRCWRARRGRRTGARLGRLLRTPAVERSATSANQAACAARARSVSPASPIASSANVRMLSSSR